VYLVLGTGGRQNVLTPKQEETGIRHKPTPDCAQSDQEGLVVQLEELRSWVGAPKYVARAGNLYWV
jgi:hypothetical protein